MSRSTLLPLISIFFLLLKLRRSDASSVPIGFVSIEEASSPIGLRAHVIKGWACVPKLSKSLNVLIYFGSEELGRIKADRPSGSHVRHKCQSGSNHDFYYRLSWKQARIFRNQKVIAIGLHGESGKELTNSGNIYIPRAPPSDVRGRIEPGPSVWKEGYKIRGWACQTGDHQSIYVDMYVGASAWEGGKFLKRVYANQPSDSQRELELCESTEFSKYRFEIPIFYPEYEKYKGEKIYVHGVSTRNTGNAQITNSGLVMIPVVSSSDLDDRCVPIYYSAEFFVSSESTDSCGSSHVQQLSDFLALGMANYFKLIGLKRSEAKVCPAHHRHLIESSNDVGDESFNTTIVDHDEEHVDIGNQTPTSDLSKYDHKTTNYRHGDDGDTSMQLQSSNDGIKKHHRALSMHKFFFGGGRCYLCSTDNFDHRTRNLVTVYGMDDDFDSWKVEAEADMAAFLKKAFYWFFRNYPDHCFHDATDIDVLVRLRQESSWDDANRCDA